MKCDGCTLCCKLLKIEWMNSPAGEYCIECFPDKGCMIYDEAPERCLEFDCAYIQMERVSINMRPDKCGVVFERLDDIMIGTVNSEVGRLNEDILNQISIFKRDGFSLVLYKKDSQTYIYSDKYSDDEIIDKIAKELRRLNGGA